MLWYHPEVSKNRSRDMLSPYFNVTVTSSLEEFKQYKAEKFYIITIFDIWAGNNSDTKKDIICWEDTFGVDFINELRTNKFPIIFDGSSECSVKSTFDSLIDFFNYVGISPKDAYLCLSNAQSVELNLEAYPNLTDYNLFSIDRFERDAIQVGITMGELLSKFKFNERKRFLFTNRRYSVDRAYLYFKLHQNKLLDNMHCTFRLENIYNDNPLTLSDVVNQLDSDYDDPSLMDYLRTNVNDIAPTLPHQIKCELSQVYKTDYKKTFLYTFWNIAAHNSTDISLVAETFRTHYGIRPNDIHYKNFYFITEKTYRTILLKQPFILFSNPHALKHLKKAGYKTFSPYINESYDSMENVFARQYLIVAEVKRISNMPPNEFNELISKCKEIANYNYEVMMNKQDDKYCNTAWTAQEIKPFLKEYDKGLPPSTLMSWHNKY